MKITKLFLLLFFSFLLNVSAQRSHRGNYDEWSLEFNVGVNKPYNTMTKGYFTSNPSFYHIDLGTRYTINPYIGVKADVGYDKFESKDNSAYFKTNYVRVNLQGVADIGYLLSFYDYADPVGILFHAGAGVSHLSGDGNIKDSTINLIYGFTGTLKVSKDVSLSADISSLAHTKQYLNFDGRAPSKYSSDLKNNLINASVGVIYYFGR